LQNQRKPSNTVEQLNKNTSNQKQPSNPASITNSEIKTRENPTAPLYTEKSNPRNERESEPIASQNNGNLFGQSQVGLGSIIVASNNVVPIQNTNFRQPVNISSMVAKYSQDPELRSVTPSNGKPTNRMSKQNSTQLNKNSPTDINMNKTQNVFFDPNTNAPRENSKNILQNRL